MDKALKPAAAEKAIRTILGTGTVGYSGHAEKRMAERNLTTVDVANVVRCGRVATVEIMFGRFRYHVSTDKICAVVEIQSATAMLIVTAWRL